ARIHPEVEQQRRIVARRRILAVSGPRQKMSLVPSLADRVDAGVAVVDETLARTGSLTEQHGRQINPVDRAILGTLAARKPDRRREEIHRAAKVLRHRAGGDPAGPPENSRLADASFPGAPLPLVEKPRRAALVALNEPRPVVAGEHDHRLLIQTRSP